MYVKWSSFATPIRTPIINQSFVVYEFTCLGCGANYQNSTVKNHLDHCVEGQYLLNTTGLGAALFSNDNNIGSADNRNSHINLVTDNTNIIDRYKNFNILLFKEALKINERKPTLNTGLKASKELQLF